MDSKILAIGGGAVALAAFFMLRGNQAPAVVETGATIKVPLYLEVGTVIKIDTRTRSYVERVR